jgi:predicted ATPase
LKAENVGYGISYTLPVIVALLSAKPGALIIIENPEAHLHPAGQSELAKLITKVANNGVQVVVETHSDHIISGIQLACKAHTKDESKGISNNDVAMYYFSPSANRSLNIKRVRILGTGMLDFQPKGFFDQAETDMFNLYE